MSSNKFCKNCGTELESNVKFCHNCGTEVSQKSNKQQNNKKREKVLTPKKSTMKSANVLLMLTFIGVLFFFIFNSSTGTNKIIDAQPTVVNEVNYPLFPMGMVPITAKVENGKIIIPLDIVKDKKFVSFSYNGSGITVPLLAYISEEGKVITAISMCEPCNSTSFHIKGSELVCNSCGTTWEVDNLEAISGSCGKYPPDPIPSVVVGNDIQINVSSVANWQRRV